MSRSTLMPARSSVEAEPRSRDRWLSLATPLAPDLSREHAERILSRSKPSPMRQLKSSAAIQF